MRVNFCLRSVELNKDNYMTDLIWQPLFRPFALKPPAKDSRSFNTVGYSIVELPNINSHCFDSIHFKLVIYGQIEFQLHPIWSYSRLADVLAHCPTKKPE